MKKLFWFVMSVIVVLAALWKLLDYLAWKK